MKNSKCFIALLLILSFFFINCGISFGQDAAVNRDFSQVLDRFDSLGLLAADTGKNITREQFIKAAVTLAGFEKRAEQLRNESYFTDTIPGTSWTGYINAACEKGWLTVIKGEEIYPNGTVPFWETCMVVLKAMGFLDANESVSRFQCIEKAREAGLLDGISIRSSEDTPVWAAEVLLDKLWLHKLSEQDPLYLADMSEVLQELGTECIVIRNAAVSAAGSFLTEGILTNRGTLKHLDSNEELQPGCKYKIALYGDLIVKIYKKLDTLECITVHSIIENIISYSNGVYLESMELPKEASYYHKGVLVSYNDASRLIQTNTTLIFHHDVNSSRYKEVFIADPVYSSAEIASSIDASTKRLGSIKFALNVPIVRNGKVIRVDEIVENDVVYEVTDIFGANSYIAVLDSKAEGELTGILPNELSPRSLVVDGNEHEISTSMNIQKLGKAADSFQEGDKVTLLLGLDGKVMDILPIQYALGPFAECTILGDSNINEWLAENQVITDKGIFFKDSGISLEPGCKYKIVLDDDIVVKVEEKLNDTTSVTVYNSIGSTVVTRNGERIRLPEKASYYYMGQAVEYESVPGLLQLNSSMIFSYNKDKTGYESILIFDPVYSDPFVVYKAEDVNDYTLELGITENDTIVRAGENITRGELGVYDVLYKVTDLWGKNSNYFAVKNNTAGYIREILPNKLTPKAVILSNNKEYEFGVDMNFSKIDFSKDSFEVGDMVRLIIGYDDRIIDVVRS